MTNVYLGSR